MKLLFGGLLGLGVLCAASLGAAQPLASHTVNPAPQASETPPLGPRRWYGWKGLTTDGAALTLAVSAVMVDLTDDPQKENWAGGLGIASAVAYGAGGPAFHLMHDQPWHALGSLGLRGSLPFLGALAWRATVTCPPPNGDYGSCGTGPILFGFAAGALAAMALDATVLAWDRPQREATPRATLGLAPVLSMDGRRELRVVGTF